MAKNSCGHLIFYIPSVVILTSVYGLSPVQANTPQVQHIGYRLPSTVYQKKQESLGDRRIVVSVGTMVLPPRSLLLCIADSIALLPKDIAVLWSVRGLNNDVLDLLSRRLATRELKMLAWIKQSDELCDSKTSVFVSHAGFNSISESVQCCSVVCWMGCVFIRLTGLYFVACPCFFSLFSAISTAMLKKLKQA